MLPLAEPGVGAWKPNKVVQTPPPPTSPFVTSFLVESSGTPQVRLLTLKRKISGIVAFDHI